MTDHTAHHFDNAVALLTLATEAINDANAAGDKGAVTVANGLRVDARDAISAALVHATLANAAAVREQTTLVHSAAASIATAYTPVVAAVIDALRPQQTEAAPDAVAVAAARVSVAVDRAGDLPHVLITRADADVLVDYVAGIRR